MRATPSLQMRDGETLQRVRHATHEATAGVLQASLRFPPPALLTQSRPPMSVHVPTGNARPPQASRAAGGGRVDVVSHSMGGLVVRSLLADSPREFEALVRAGALGGSRILYYS